MGSLLQGLTGLNPFSVMIRMVIAVFSGAVIGYGRGQRRSAGMKTHAMVCLGACLVMCAGEYVAEVYGGSDVTRLGAQVISGIGFLGAGTIIKAPGNKIWGLTTASGLWCSACLGLAVGIGFYWGVLIALGGIFLITFGFNNRAGQMRLSRRYRMLYVEYLRREVHAEILNLIRDRGGRILQFESETHQDQRQVYCSAYIEFHMRDEQTAQMLVEMIRQREDVLMLEEM